MLIQVGVPGNATALGWHHRLNQIFVGLGECDGFVIWWLCRLDTMQRL